MYKQFSRTRIFLIFSKAAHFIAQDKMLFIKPLSYHLDMRENLLYQDDDFHSTLPKWFCKMIKWSSLLHNIGIGTTLILKIYYIKWFSFSKTWKYFIFVCYCIINCLTNNGITTDTIIEFLPWKLLEVATWSPFIQQTH